MCLAICASREPDKGRLDDAAQEPPSPPFPLCFINLTSVHAARCCPSRGNGFFVPSCPCQEVNTRSLLSLCVPFRSHGCCSLRTSPHLDRCHSIRQGPLCLGLPPPGTEGIIFAHSYLASAGATFGPSPISPKLGSPTSSHEVMTLHDCLPSLLL